MSIPFENVFFAAICWFCAVIFGAIAFWAFKRKDPMHFWAGSKVKPEEIIDIPAYNHTNGLMWTAYTAAMVITGILSLFSIGIGATLLVIICFPGVFILVIVYRSIYNKYSNQNDVY